MPIAVRVDRLSFLIVVDFFPSRTGYSGGASIDTPVAYPFHYDHRYAYTVSIYFFRKIWTSLSKLLNCTYLVTGYRPSATLWEKFFDSLGHER